MMGSMRNRGNSSNLKGKHIVFFVFLSTNQAFSYKNVTFDEAELLMMIRTELFNDEKFTFGDLSSWLCLLSMFYFHDKFLSCSTSDDGINEESRELLKCERYAFLLMNIGHVIIGYSVCWSAPVILKLGDPQKTALEKPLTEEQAAWLTSIFHIGTLIGSQVGAFLSNFVGRKPTLILFGTLCLTSHIIRVTAGNFTTLIIGRVANGLGVGGMLSGNLVYIGEIASSDLRGIILTSTGVFHTLGGLLVYSVGPYVSYPVVEYILTVLGILHVISLFFIIESPLYHVIKGDDEAARNTLNNLGRSKDIDNELKTMIENVKERNIQYTQLNAKSILPNWTWFDIFRRRRNRRALLITSTLFTIQEGSGIICIMSYATTIFNKATSSVNADVATILLGVVQVFGIILAPILVDRFGRKPLLIFSTAACSLFAAILGVHFYGEQINHPTLSSIRWLPLATLILFLISYNAGLGIIPNVLVGEVFSPKVRSTGAAMALCLCCISAFLSSLSFGYIILLVGTYFIFVVFAVFNAFGCFFTLKFVPETKGKSLTEIDAMLAR